MFCSIIPPYLHVVAKRWGVSTCKHSNFDDWTKWAFALSSLGEAGREIFNSISMLSSKYSEAENDRKLTNALRTNRKIGIGTFIYMCRMHGIDTNKFFDHSPVEVVKPLATVATSPKVEKEPLRFSQVTSLIV